MPHSKPVSQFDKASLIAREAVLEFSSVYIAAAQKTLQDVCDDPLVISYLNTLTDFASGALKAIENRLANEAQYFPPPLP